MLSALSDVVVCSVAAEKLMLDIGVVVHLSYPTSGGMKKHQNFRMATFAC